MNETLNTIRTRRSVRVYTEQQVSAEDLNLILEAAVCAPSGMNFQDWHFTAIQKAELLVQLNDKIKSAFAKSDNPQWQERGHSNTYCCYYHAPTLVIVSGKADSPLSPSDCACALEEYLPCRQVSRHRLLLDKPVGTDVRRCRSARFPY